MPTTTTGATLLARRPPTNTPSNRTARTQALLILLFIALVALRIPAIFAGGRFWAEEGPVYFYHAWTQPWFQALFTIHTGYLNIVASTAALAALHLVPLEQAPLVTSTIALAIQTLPAILLATSCFSWVQRWPWLAVGLITLLIPGGDTEVWVNSITSQFHLALCVGLILAADIRGGWVGILRAVVLVVAPLAGPISGTLAPLFLLRAGLERSFGRLLQTLLLSMPVLIQLLIVATHPEPARSIGIGLPLLLTVIGIQNVVLPFLGPSQTLGISLADMHMFENGGIPAFPIVAAMVALGGLGLALWRCGDRTAGWLFAAGCTLAVGCYSAALTLGQPLHLLLWIGGRYTFPSTVLLSLSLLALAARGPLLQRAIPLVAVTWMIGTGVIHYFQVPPQNAHGANWQAEVAAWRRDPNYKLHMWPLGWVPELTLDTSARPGH